MIGIIKGEPISSPSEFYNRPRTLSTPGIENGVAYNKQNQQIFN